MGCRVCIRRAEVLRDSGTASQSRAQLIGKSAASRAQGADDMEDVDNDDTNDLSELIVAAATAVCRASGELVHGMLSEHAQAYKEFCVPSQPPTPSLPPSLPLFLTPSLTPSLTP